MNFLQLIYGTMLIVALGAFMVMVLLVLSAMKRRFTGDQFLEESENEEGVQGE